MRKELTASKSQEYVASWLNDQRNQSEFEQVTSPNTLELPLVEVSGNIMSLSHRSMNLRSQSPKKSPQRPLTPSKRLTRDTSRSPSEHGFERVKEKDAEQVETSRSNLPARGRSFLSPIPTLQPTGSVRQTDLNASSHGGDEGESDGEGEEARLSRSQIPASDAGSLDSKGRTKSPAKQVRQLQFLQYPVDPQTWSRDAMPPEIQPLVRAMELISKGVGILPLGVKPMISTTEEIILEHNWEKPLPEGEAEKEAVDKATGGIGHIQFWREVSGIRRATNESSNDGEPEAQWNAEVHARVLRLALEGHFRENEIWYQNISTARLSSKKNLPTTSKADLLTSKIVDYAIVIKPKRDFSVDPSKSLHLRIVEKLSKYGGDSSINHTKADYVRFKPLCVNIETKKGAVSEPETHVQLATWLMAQYIHLHYLQRPAKDGKKRAKLPCFPVLSVLGMRWILMIVCVRENPRIDLFKELCIGDTSTFIGVYQVIAAVRMMGTWIIDVYLPWFKSEILEMEEEKVVTGDKKDPKKPGKPK